MKTVQFSFILAVILDFYIKYKNANISKTERDRVILSEFWNQRVLITLFTVNFGAIGCRQLNIQTLEKNIFASFGGHSEFLLKIRGCICLVNRVRLSDLG